MESLNHNVEFVTSMFLFQKHVTLHNVGSLINSLTGDYYNELYIRDPRYSEEEEEEEVETLRLGATKDSKGIR